jgi:uncharacterized protein YjaZ
MTMRFHWPITESRLPRYEELSTTLAVTVARVQRMLPIDDVDVTLVVGTPGTIPQWGVGGYTSGPAQVSIFLDPANLRFAEAAMPERLSATLAHELHHAARMRGPGYGKTLGEVFVTEGLAQIFEQETGHPIAFYSTHIAGSALTKMADRALLALDDPGYDHAAWFFGRISDPLHGGYAIAYTLAKKWLALNETTAATSVTIDPERVLQPWRNGTLRFD